MVVVGLVLMMGLELELGLEWLGLRLRVVLG